MYYLAQHSTEGREGVCSLPAQPTVFLEQRCGGVEKDNFIGLYCGYNKYKFYDGIKLLNDKIFLIKIREKGGKR